MQAGFLRKVYPDIEVSSSLIKDEIALDAEVLRKRQFFDPAIGNLLETVYCDEGSRKLTTFLAFPMGESSSQLSEYISTALDFLITIASPRHLAIPLFRAW